MKNIKKLLSLLLVILMVGSICITNVSALMWRCWRCGSEEPYGPCSNCDWGNICSDCGRCDECDTFVTNIEKTYTNEDVANGKQMGTHVAYVGQGSESYTVTVPATMLPDSTATIVAEGTWASNRKLVVTADSSVELVNSINANDNRILTITFAGIEKVGDNTQAVSATEPITVGAIENALFGTWSGTFYYDVKIVNNLQPNDGQFVFAIDGDYYLAKDGMIWYEWMNSNYNTLNDIGIDLDGNVTVGELCLTIEDKQDQNIYAEDEIINGANYVISTRSGIYE